MSSNQYLHQLDSKNRMRIPAKFRERLGNDYYVTAGVGGCLNVYTKEQMEKERLFLSKINKYREDQLKVARYILDNMWKAEEDKQGRILIPETLRKKAKIEKNVKVVEGPICIEIWAEDVWERYFDDIDFSVLADALDSMDSNG